MKNSVRQLLLFITPIVFGASYPLTGEETAGTPVQETVVEKSEGGDSSIDWFEMAVATGYLLGVFVLFPAVLFLNVKEGLYDPEVSANAPEPLDLELAEREERASVILDQIVSGWGDVETEEGGTVRTITTRKEALKTHAGLDYIRKYLVPVDESILERVKELEGVYEERTRRIFTGSNWVLGAAVLTAVLFYLTAGFKTFLLIHVLGIAFYYFSSKTPAYILERRLALLGSMPGMISGVMGGLAAGAATRHYVRENGGAWKRDWESEGQMGMMVILLVAVASLFLGFLAAFLGVLNFFLNYMGTFFYPWKSIEERYRSQFAG